MSARGGTRTRKPLRAMDFESIEYADFSTRAGAEKGSGMRSPQEVALVMELVRAERNDCEIARETGIPRSTVRQWRKGQTPTSIAEVLTWGPMVGREAVRALSVAVIR